MLMRNFLSAEELNISEIERDGLIKVLNALERGELVSYRKWLESKNKETIKPLIMAMWFTHDIPECGTVGCIAGWANIMTGGKAFENIVFSNNGSYFKNKPELEKLFSPLTYHNHSMFMDIEIITKALTNFLTTGKVVKKTRTVFGRTYREF
jgi:hypothetical protein